MSILALSFNDVKLEAIQQDNSIWLGATQIGLALGYANPETAITKLYNRNSDEFRNDMTKLVEMNTSGGLQKIRIFSLRGCHLIGFLAKTAIAKQFRKWALDVLDKEVGQPVAKTHKSEREPLTNAVNMLVAKTKHLNYSDAYKLVHQRFNVKSIDEIPYDAIPVAVEYVHYLIALYSNNSKQGSLFDDTTYELVREFTESVLSQNFMMQDVWQALMLINKKDMMYYSQYVIDSNTMARKVSIALDFKTKKGEPLIDGFCQTINFVGGVKFTGVNPKWFNAPAW